MRRMALLTACSGIGIAAVLGTVAVTSTVASSGVTITRAEQKNQFSAQVAPDFDPTDVSRLLDPTNIARGGNVTTTWDWSDEASEASDRVQTAIRESSDHPIFSTIAIDDELQKVVAHFTSEPSQRTKDAARDASGEIPVTFAHDSLVTNEQFVALVESMYERLSPDRTKFGLISPNVANTEVWVTVWSGPNQDETARKVRQAMWPLKVHIEHGPRPMEAMNYSSRWFDTSLFKGGAALLSKTGTLCTSGFAAKRNSDGQKVMITAEHCGLGATWTTAGGGVKYGTGWYRSSSTDSQYMMAPAGTGYGSLIYSGSVDATSTKVRKNSAYNASVGDKVYTGGAISGGDSQKVVAINQFGGLGEGPGFLTDSIQGFRAVGEGDSGGPVFRLHSDGKYTPLGMIKGNGWAVNSSPRIWATQGGCQKGVIEVAPGTPRLCSVRSFHINTTAIESALKVDFYKP